MISEICLPLYIFNNMYFTNIFIFVIFLRYLFIHDIDKIGIFPHFSKPNCFLFFKLGLTYYAVHSCLSMIFTYFCYLKLHIIVKNVLVQVCTPKYENKTWLRGHIYIMTTLHCVIIINFYMIFINFKQNFKLFITL